MKMKPREWKENCTINLVEWPKFTTPTVSNAGKDKVMEQQELSSCCYGNAVQYSHLGRPHSNFLRIKKKSHPRKQQLYFLVFTKGSIYGHTKTCE